MHPQHTLWAHTAHTWLTNRKHEQKRSGGGGRIAFGLPLLGKAFLCPPTELTRTLSGRANSRNTGAFVPSTATFLKQGSVSMPAKMILSQRKCRRRTGSSVSHLERLHILLLNDQGSLGTKVETHRRVRSTSFHLKQEKWSMRGTHLDIESGRQGRGGAGWGRGNLAGGRSQGITFGNGAQHPAEYQERGLE